LIFKKAYKYEFFALYFDAYAHKACRAIGSDSNIILLQCHWNFREMAIALELSREKEIYKKMKCGYYDEELKYKEGIFHNELMENMRKGKCIYVILNMENYGMMEGTNEYAHHCTSLIFYPRMGGNYDCFYINSHGEDFLLTNHFDIRLTRTRKRKIVYGEPPEIVYLKRYLQYLRKNIVKRNYEIQIHYNHTKWHNYYGANLQSGDGHGVCFAFPLVIWYYLSNFYTHTRRYTHKEQCLIIPSMESLLKQKKIITMVNSCFHIFHNEYTNKLIMKQKSKQKYALRNSGIYYLSPEKNTYGRIHKYTQLSIEEIAFTKSIEEIIIKKDFLFIKRIVYAIVSLLTTPALKKLSVSIS